MARVARVENALAGVRRKARSPQHSWNVKAPPFGIQQFMIAPVLAGETLTNLLFQSKVVTDPIKNRLVGWHHEVYFFYVKLRDLDDRVILTNMLINPATDISGIDQPLAQPENYHPVGAGMINYGAKCMKRIIETYFRDEGEAFDTYGLGHDNGIVYYSAKINGDKNPFHSAHQADDVDAIDVALEVGVDGEILASEIDALQREWMIAQQMGLTNLNYEDYLATFGVKPKAEELHKPELIRYTRHWAYPTNTVEPTTGTPTSAIVWSLAERADKTKFFREPGFIIGLTVTRPKVYLGNQNGTFSSTLNDFKSWLPAMLQADPNARLKRLADGVGPFTAGSDGDGYEYDIADLFTYGEQFVHPGVPANASLPLPAATLVNKKYPAAFADVQALFVGSDPPSYVEQDGVVSLTIQSTITDMSPVGGPAIVV